jgi:dephospho-CoA kinase
VYAPGGPAVEPLVRLFGDGIVGPDGGIDRRALGQVVFNDAERLRRLTDIVWPLARARAEAIGREQAAAGTRVFVIEAPLLIEAGWRDLVDEVWLVHAPLAAVRQRLAERGLSAADAEARIAARGASAEDAGAADVVIENDGSLDQLEARIEAAWRALAGRTA